MLTNPTRCDLLHSVNILVSLHLLPLLKSLLKTKHCCSEFGDWRPSPSSSSSTFVQHITQIPLMRNVSHYTANRWELSMPKTKSCCDGDLSWQYQLTTVGWPQALRWRLEPSDVHIQAVAVTQPQAKYSLADHMLCCRYFSLPPYDRAVTAAPYRPIVQKER